MKFEIYYNKKKGYTLEKNVGGVNSEKRRPIKFKVHDSTARFRKAQLKEELLKRKKE